MRTALFLILSVAVLSGAEDSWTKIRELKGGTELRIFTKGKRQPILAKADEATEDKLLVVLKSEQVAIAKDDIDRIDARPLPTTSRVTRETKQKTQESIAEPGSSTRPQNAPGSNSSSTTSFSMSTKPEFETIYRRSPVILPH